MKTKNSIIYELKDDDILYFLHIPKTAGTTFTSIIDSYFDFNSIFPEKIWPGLLNNKPNNFSKFKLIRGHFGYGIHRILEKNPVIITMLRDPISRIISSIDHIRYYPIGTNWVPDNFIPKNKSILEILKDPLKKIFFENDQTRHLGLDLGELLLSKEGINELRKENNLLGSILKCKRPSDKKLLENAKQRLEQFAYFGLVERFEESLFLLYYTFGWKPNKSIWKMMITGKTNKNDVSIETLSAIKNCVNLDFELYKFAEKLFQSRFLQIVNELKERYYKSRFDKLSFIDMMYEMLEINFEEYVKKLKISQVSRINFDFGQKMLGSGWYFREYFDNTKFCRWTGPDTKSTLEFPLSGDKDLKIKFNVINQASTDILNSLKLFLNDSEIKLTSTKTDQTHFEGIISKSLIKKNPLTRLTFSVSHTKETKQSIFPLFTKTRKVGVAIEKISISPS